MSQIFNNLLRRQIGTRWPTVEHLSAKEETIFAALRGSVSLALYGVGAPTDAFCSLRYENADVALNTGMILRAMLRHEPLAQILLYSDKCVRARMPSFSDSRLTRRVRTGSTISSTTSSRQRSASHATRRPTSACGHILHQLD